MSIKPKSISLPTIIPILLFFGSGVAAIALNEPWILIVPFFWILFPVIVNYVVSHADQFFWLLLILLPLSSELQITNQLGIDFPDEIFMILLTGLGIVKMIHQPKWVPQHVLRHPLFFLLVIQLIWICITCIYSTDPLLSVKYLLAKTWYIFPLVILPQVLIQDRSNITKLAFCLLIPMFLVVIQTLIRHSFFGFSFISVKYILKPFFRNHVNYSSMLAALLPVAWCVWKLTPIKNAKRKWIFYGMIIGLVGLLFAYSRGAWVALILGITAAWLIKKKWMKGFMIASITFVLLSVTWLVVDQNFMRFAPDHDHTIFHTDFSEHMIATVEMKDVSTAERFYRWIAGAKMLAEKPITGFGPNSFYNHYRPYAVNRFETWVSDNPEHSTVHNYFLLVALEQGIVGLILFCLLFFAMLLHLQKLYHQFQSRFYQMVSLTTGVVLVIIGTINAMSDMIETDKIGGLFWLCLGMTILLKRKLGEERELLAKANNEH